MASRSFCWKSARSAKSAFSVLRYARVGTSGEDCSSGSETSSSVCTGRGSTAGELPRWRLFWLRALSLAAVQLALSAVFTSRECYFTKASLVTDLCAWLVLVMSQVLRWNKNVQSSPLLPEMRTLFVSGWLQLLSAHVMVVAQCMHAQVASIVAKLAYRVMDVFLMYWYTGMLQKRVELTQVAFGQDLGARRIARTRLTAACVLVLTESVEFEIFRRCELVLSHALPCRLAREQTASELVLLVAGVSSAAWAVIAHNTVRQAARCSMRHAYVQAEAAWARQVITRLRNSIALSMLTISIMSWLPSWGDIYSNAREVHNSIRLMSISIVEMALAVCIVGMFQPQRPRLPIQGGLERTASTLSQMTSDKAPEWNDTVHELAGRSIDVGSLVAFYDRLCDPDGPMPDFSPRRSTTNDIVRQVIIPMTRTSDGGGTAYACLARKSGQQWPFRMVTHTWSNSFSNLVGAILADVLGEEEYVDVVQQLVGSPEQRRELAERLHKEEVLDHRYWVCAFCVNQHTSICDSLGQEPPAGTGKHIRWDISRRNSVTKEIFNVCDCQQRKRRNDHPSECEMNKFDDMLAFLSREIPHFRLLVAVDADFEIFSRAWCVAEIVEAYKDEIPVKMCLMTNKSLDVDADDLSVYTKLASLAVEECEASRPEDKAAILAKIPDVEVFDAQLQLAIFGDRGLLRRHLTGFGCLEAAAQSARRIHAATLRRENCRKFSDGLL